MGQKCKRLIDAGRRLWLSGVIKTGQVHLTLHSPTVSLSLLLSPNLSPLLVLFFPSMAF